MNSRNKTVISASGEKSAHINVNLGFLVYGVAGLSLPTQSQFLGITTPKLYISPLQLCGWAFPAYIKFSFLDITTCIHLFNLGIYVAGHSLPT